MGASSGSTPDRRIERTASTPRRRALRRAFLQSRSAFESTRLRQPRTVPGLLRLAPVSVRFRDAALETLSPFRNRSRRLRHRRGERENRQEPDEAAILLPRFRQKSSSPRSVVVCATGSGLQTKGRQTGFEPLPRAVLKRLRNGLAPLFQQRRKDKNEQRS